MKRYVLGAFLFLNFSWSQVSKDSTYYHYACIEKSTDAIKNIVYVKGTYHLFLPSIVEAKTGTSTLNHVISTDLLNWVSTNPISLSNSDTECVMETVVVDQENAAGLGNNTLLALVSHRSKGKNATKGAKIFEFEYSANEGKSWEKLKYNTDFIKNEKETIQSFQLIWNEPFKKWHLIQCLNDGVKIWSSPNLTEWQYESTFKPIENESEKLWENGSLFSIKTTTGEEKWLLIVDIQHTTSEQNQGSFCYIGTFDGTKFTNEQTPLALDYGTDAYSSAIASTPEKTLLRWSNSNEEFHESGIDEGTSTLLLPKTIELYKENNRYKIRQQVLSSIPMKLMFEEKNIQTSYEKTIHEWNRSLVSLTFQKASDCMLLFSNELGETYSVTFSEKNLIVDRRMAESYTFESKPQSIPMEDNLLNLDVFLDQNLIEILANKGKYVITQHIQPTQNFTKVTLITKETSSIYAIKCQHITLEQ